LGAPQKPQGAAPSGRLGVLVEDLTSEQRSQTGIEEHGVIVKEVKNGAAQEAGIQAGDVIVMFDGATVKNAAQFKELVDKVEAGRSVAVLVQRRSGPAFLALRLPKAD
jgi:serine protease Do